MSRSFRLLSLIIAVAMPRRGHAQDPPPSPDAQSRRVEVQIDVAGSQTAIRATAETSLELVARLRIIPTMRAVDAIADTDRGDEQAGSASTRIHALIDLRSLSAATVHVTDRASHGVLVHRILPVSPSLDVTVEAAAHIVYAAVDSFLRVAETRGADRGPVTGGPASPRTEAQISATAEEMPTARGLGLGLEAGVFVGANAFEGAAPYYGIGGDLDLRARNVSLRPGVRISATLYAPAHHQVATVDAAIKTVSFRLVPTIEWLRTPALDGFVGIGPGLDWFRVSPTPPPVSVGQVRQKPSNLDPIIAAVVGGRIRLGRELTFTLDVGVDLDVTPRRYVVASGNDSVDLFAPSRLRPSVTAGLSFPVAGARRSEDATRAGIERFHE